ncbi:MAG: hypothetical protein ACPGQL_09220 [Thermoplasmatota archaeon]
MRSLEAVRGRLMALLAFGSLGPALQFSGFFWDVRWHTIKGRDSFFVAPHNVAYGGMVVVFAMGVLGCWLLRKHVDGGLRGLWKDPVGRGFVGMVAGGALMFVYGGIDDLFHRSVGLDNSIWSPPHIAILTGMLLGGAGVVAALRGLEQEPGRDGFGRGKWKAAEFLAIVVLMGNFGVMTVMLGQMERFLLRREMMWYMPMVAMMGSLAYTMAAQITPRFGFASAAALAYTFMRITAQAIMVLTGFDTDITAPVWIFPAAIVLDVVLRKKSQGAFLAGIALFGPIFLLAEQGSRLVLGVPAAWHPVEVLSAMVMMALFSLGGGLAGNNLAALMRGDRTVGDDAPRPDPDAPAA